jgi:hypothetical protein
VSEAARPAARRVVSPADAPPPAARIDVDEPVAPVVVIHGVGDFAPGDVIGQVARQPAFSRHDAFRRETLFASNYRYSVLRDRGEGTSAAASPVARLVEVNWAEVRRATPNLLGILRNFVFVMLAMNRIAVYGAVRSSSLAGRLWTGVLALWLIEGVAVWAALAPALSTLLWQVEQGQRFAVGGLAAGAIFLVALRLRRVSLPLGCGGMLFAAVAAFAGWWSCSQRYGDQDVAGFAAQGHLGATFVAVLAVLLAAIETLCRRGADGLRPPFVHRLSRMACLWLPMVMLMLLQPLTVAALLATMDADARSNWGFAFSYHLPFEPEEVERAVGWIALLMAGALLLGALQFKTIQRWGRNVTLGLGWGVGLAAVLVALGLEKSVLDGCELCQQCLRADWLGGAGFMLVIGATLTWALFARSEVARDASGLAWYPAGAFARFWASVMLAAMPLVLIGAAAWLLSRAPRHVGVPIVVDASVVFLQSTKYALLLAPLATKPFAAFLDALGDVFFFVVRDRGLNTRLDTLPRLAKALQLMQAVGAGGAHRHVVLLAHSQGTAIAATLLSRVVRLLCASQIRLTLVTIGSPVSTLYRNFLGVQMGADFAALCQREPERFRWFNLCRPADYIGGEVELPGVVNRDLLTPGDHVGYWCDAELMAWMASLSRGESA